MKQHFSNLTTKTFILRAIAMFLVCDAIIFTFLYLKIVDYEKFLLIVELTKTMPMVPPQMRENLSYLSHNQIREIFGLIRQTMLLLLMAASVFHLIMYALFYKRNVIGINYCKLLKWTELIGFFFLATKGFSLGAWHFIFLLPFLMNLYLVLGWKQKLPDDSGGTALPD